MVNAETAPALPWGSSTEQPHANRAHQNSSRIALTASTAETTADHSGTSQALVAMPRTGSVIEVSNSHVQSPMVPATSFGATNESTIYTLLTSGQVAARRRKEHRDSGG